MPVCVGFVKALWPASGIGCRGARDFTRGRKSHGFDDAILSLHDVQAVTRDSCTGAWFGDVPEVFEDEPVERLWPVERKVVTELAVEFAQQAAPFHDVRT